MNHNHKRLFEIGSLLSVFLFCGCSFVHPLEKRSISPKRAISNEYLYIETPNYSKTAIDIFDIYFSSNSVDINTLNIRTNDNTNLWSEKSYSLSNYSNYIGVRVYLISNAFQEGINNFRQGTFLVPFSLGNETYSSVRLDFDNGSQYENGLLTYTGFANPIDYYIQYSVNTSPL